MQQSKQQETRPASATAIHPLSHARPVGSTVSPSSDASQASPGQALSGEYTTALAEGLLTPPLQLPPGHDALQCRPGGPGAECAGSAAGSTASQRILGGTPASLDWSGFTGEGPAAGTAVEFALGQVSLEGRYSPEQSGVAGTQGIQGLSCKPFKPGSHPEESSPPVPPNQLPGVQAYPASKEQAPHPSSSEYGQGLPVSSNLQMPGQDSVAPPWAAAASARATEREALSVATARGELGNGSSHSNQILSARCRNEVPRVPRAGSPAPAGLSRQPSDLPAWLSRSEEASTEGSCRALSRCSSSSSSLRGDRLCAPWATHEGLRSAERGAVRTSASVLQPSRSALQSNAGREVRQAPGDPFSAAETPGAGPAGGLDRENAWPVPRETGKGVADCGGPLKQGEAAGGVLTSRMRASLQRSGCGAKDCLTWAG